MPTSAGSVSSSAVGSTISENPVAITRKVPNHSDLEASHSVRPSRNASGRIAIATPVRPSEVMAARVSTVSAPQKSCGSPATLSAE